MTRRQTARSTALPLLVLVVGFAGSGLAAAAPSRQQLAAVRSITVPAGGSAVVKATERADGHTITIRRGQRLRLALSSTYWRLQPSSDATVLRVLGKPTVTPQPSGCVPGAGCGTVTATYLAAADGQATITATRTSCGEAMGCTAAAGRFTLDIVVR